LSQVLLTDSARQVGAYEFKHKRVEMAQELARGAFITGCDLAQAGLLVETFIWHGRSRRESTSHLRHHRAIKVT